MKGSVVITGGGTGGHLKVAKEFVEEFYKRGNRPYFIGSKNGQDKEWFERDLHIKKSFFLDTKGVVNKDFMGKISSLWQIFLQTQKCLDVFDKADVKTVISVGGFSAAPATFAAILRPGCKLYIHEQNSVMGKLNQLTSRFATTIFSSYDMNSPVRDYPVNEEFFEKGRIRENDVQCVIFLGGSQGAKAINDYALSVAYELNQKGIKIIHQTGAADHDRVLAQYHELGIQADVFAFVDDISSKMAQADFAVSRAGASTLWELSANSLPTLFVPYPHAAADHQFYNAKFLKDRKMCFVARESDLTKELFFKCLKTNLNMVSQNLASSINFGATQTMVDYILHKNKK